MDTNSTFNTTFLSTVTTTLTTWSTKRFSHTDDLDPFFSVSTVSTYTNVPTASTINSTHLETLSDETKTPILDLTFSKYINRYATLFFVIIGIPSNILCFILWRKPALWNVSGVYMASLAISDLCALFLNQIKDLHLVWGIKILDYTVFCYTFPLLLSSSQQLSTYFGLGFTVERYISVFYPFQRNVYCTEERAQMFVIGFVVFCFLLNSPQAYFWFLDTYTYKDTNVTITYCALRSEVDQGVFSTYNIYVFVAEGISFGLVPIIVLVLDGFLIRQMIRLSTALVGMTRNRNWKTSSTTFTLLAVSVFQIITTLPDTFAKSLYNTYKPDNSDSEETVRKYVMYNLAAAITEEIRICHFTFNFFIYYLINTKFRIETKRIVYRMINKEYILPQANDNTDIYMVRTSIIERPAEKLNTVTNPVRVTLPEIVLQKSDPVLAMDDPDDPPIEGEDRSPEVTGHDKGQTDLQASNS